MRKTCALTLAVALIGAVACASGGGSSSSKLDPKISFRPVKVPESRTALADSFGSFVEITIENTAAEPITVDRIQFSSVSVGTYIIQPVNERPQKEIAPGATETFRLWAQVQVQPTASEGLDPIMIRGAVEFLAASGGFRKTFAQQVNPSSLR